jgi:hypothetical protein
LVQAVESGANASVPECVNVYVDPDPLPLFHVAVDQTMGDPGGPLPHNMSGMVRTFASAQLEFNTSTDKI